MKNKVWFMENVKKALDAGMLCAIGIETVHSIMNKTWIGDLGASCHILQNDTRVYDVANINESVQGSSGNISATKTGKLCIKVCQDDGSELEHVPWPMKYCTKPGVNLYSLTCNLLQGNKI